MEGGRHVSIGLGHVLKLAHVCAHIEPAFKDGEMSCFQRKRNFATYIVKGYRLGRLRTWTRAWFFPFGKKHYEDDQANYEQNDENADNTLFDA